MLGLGKKGIQAAQILGAQIGLVVTLIGTASLVAQTNEKLLWSQHFENLNNLVNRQPLIIWAAAGFMVAYILFFIVPTFLDDRLQFQYFFRFLPDTTNLGPDIRTMTKYINLWLIDGKSPYTDNTIFYPPLYNVIIAPIVLLGYPNSYYFMLVMGIVSYFGLTFILPMLHRPNGDLTLPLFFFLTGIFSYGL